MDKRNPSALVCPECGGDFSAADLLDGDSIVTCLGCGKRFSTSEIFHQSTDEKVEEIRSKAYTDVEKDRTQAYRDVEEGKRKIEYERLKHEFDKEERQEKEQEIKAFKKSKFRIVLIVFIVISVMMCAVAFNDGKIWAGIVAVIMTGLFVIAFLMGNNVIKEKRKNLRLIPAIIAFVLFVPCCFLYSGSNLNLGSQGEEFVWSDLELNSVLPQPTTTYGEILSDSDKHLSVYIHNASESDFNAYINKCKEFGYTIDSESATSSYDAYNASGYKLRIWYSDFSKEYNISLDAPKQKNDINWNTIEIMKQLPIPTSSVGEISSEYSTSFSVYVLNTSKEDYLSYVDACIANGFNVDYSKYDTSFYADNASGYSLTLKYEGYDTMYLYIKKND